ncbi:MAG: hypothetical protein JWM27_2149 [Gemmatimonadetes bacterium]|nr:hypothetical protein [Gemmatimonadota bacterium]
MAKRSLRETGMDTLTAVVALAAVLVVVDRYVHPVLTTPEPDAGGVERALVGLRPPTLRVTEAVTHRAAAMPFRASGRQLVLLFRTTCPACERTRPQWERIAAAIPAAVPVNAISKENVEAPYFAGARIRVWQAASPTALRQAFPSPFVPTTLILSPDGRVEYARVGVLGAAAADSIAAILAGRLAAAR